MTAVTHERAKEALDYRSDTGEFRWLTGRCQGKVAGRIHIRGYRLIRLDGGDYQAHRLAWFITYGEFPADVIDHINGDKLDNRIANLRDVTRTQNNQNRIVPGSQNRSGLIGAQWDKRDGKWHSNIRAGGKKRHLGRFGSALEAHQAYMAAKSALHPFWVKERQ